MHRSNNLFRLKNNVVYTHLAGTELLHCPLLNKDTAFSHAERDMFHLQGLLPQHEETIEEQVTRCYRALCDKETPIQQHIYLRQLQDQNETLFYRLIIEHIAETMPLIYTPTVGEACQEFSRIYRRARGLFISYPEKEHILSILDNSPTTEVKVIVVTDGERILGLGDQGAGGMGIPIGKLSLYSACGGINPMNTLPILLDVGTNNKQLFDDPGYVGWRHERITGDEYFEFVDMFVKAVMKKFPNVLLQFEDFAQPHAYPLLEKYRDQLCCFNDDIQGTAAVSVSGILAAVKSLHTKLKDHKIAVFGAGSAGCGISEQLVRAMQLEGLSESQARSQFFMVDRNGLLVDDMSGLLPFQKNLIQKRSSLSGWKIKNPAMIGLAEVMLNAKPSILLGVSGQPNQFTADIIKVMHQSTKRPIIFPMSNPTSRCEAQPKDIMDWTEGNALVATGSPFDSVNYLGKSYPIAQCNNCYIFPGMGLGIIAVGANRVTDGMFMAASLALSDLAPALHTRGGALLPELSNIRDVSKVIALAVAKQAIKEGIASILSDDLIQQRIEATSWMPEYHVMELDGKS